MSPDEEKRRTSIAYILRRRKRGRKARANSGEIVKSWAEASEVNFKPTGAYMETGRSLVLFAGCIAAGAPLIMFLAARSFAMDHPDDPMHPAFQLFGWMLLVIAALLIIAICLFAIAYVARSVWRVFARHQAYKKE